MAYFQQFPNVYVGEGVKDDEPFKYRLIKNLFRRVKAREDLDQYTTLFEVYEIRDGETPSILAQKFFSDPFYDWVILLVNNITDVYSQWPKDNESLSNYVNDKYNDPDEVHHYETNEIKDENDDIFFPKGIQVNNTFRITMPNGDVKTETESIYPVSNYEYEYYENEKTRQIRIPIGSMVSKIVEEMADIIGYESHAELDESNNKLTPANIASRFLNNTGYVSGSIEVNNSVGAVTSWDNGDGVTITPAVYADSTTSNTTAASATPTSTTTTTTTSATDSTPSNVGTFDGGETVSGY